MEEQILEVPVKIYYLKMSMKPEVEFDRSDAPDFTFQRLATPISTEDYLYFYRTVGEAYNWLDRLLLEKSKLYDEINSPKTELFIYSVFQKFAGFAEFVRESEYTEILYFGLFPDYIGKGYGKSFMQTVINEAWHKGSKWIQLNTCELDHPNALPTYLKSGFELDKVVVENRKVKQLGEF
ncbi:GNAT family N-acetyltransferase [Draconibacterium sp.]|uniref:GNAT family N-acetyltransferase n=1 Tax=Draconibacterium sp. TaxID=1965318 RepID=UPI003565E76F